MVPGLIIKNWLATPLVMTSLYYKYEYFITYIYYIAPFVWLHNFKLLNFVNFYLLFLLFECFKYSYF